MEKIVSSIDVGYGQTKFVKESNNGKFTRELFPSVAPTIIGPFLQDPLLKTNDVIKVEVEGVTRVVGKDGLHAHLINIPERKRSERLVQLAVIGLAFQNSGKGSAFIPNI